MFRLPSSSALRRWRIVLWLTGLSSAGKSTIGEGLVRQLQAAGHRAELLDGDAVRQRLCKDLGFSKHDRDENIRRIGFVAELLAKHGVIVAGLLKPLLARRELHQRNIKLSQT